MTARTIFWTTFMAMALVYGGALLLLPPEGFFIADGGCKFIQARALIENHYSSLAVPWPGATIDPTARFDPLPEPFGQRVDGRLYGFYSPTFALVSAWSFTAMGHRGLSLIPLVSGLALLVLTAALARRLPGPGWTSPLAMVLVGLATPVWFYSLAYWEHVPAATFLVASVLLVLRCRQSARALDAFAAGLSCAVAIHFRDELYLFAACLAVALLAASRRRGAISFGLGVAMGLAPSWWIQAVAVGHPLGVRLAAVADGVWSGDYLAARLEAARVLLVQAHPDTWRSLLLVLPLLGLLAWQPALSARRFTLAVVVVASWSLLLGAVVLGDALTASVPMQWLLQSNGFFAAAPWLALGSLRRSDDDPAQDALRWLGRLVLAYVVLYLVATPADNVAGVHWGCRLLFPVYPLLGTMAVSTLSVWWTSKGRGRGGQALLTWLVAISVAAQVHSLRLLHERKTYNAEVNRVVAERAESAVAAVGWSVPMELSGNFFEKSIFMVRSPRQLGELLLHLQSAGLSRAWVVSTVPLTGLPLDDRRNMIDPTGFALEMGSIDVTRIAPAKER